MKIDRVIVKPETPQLSAWSRVSALIPAGINVALASSPAFLHHPRLQVIAVLSGLFAGALMFGWWYRLRIAVSGALVIIGVSHLYLIASVAIVDHLSDISIMNEMMGMESALWSNFATVSVAMVFLLQGSLPPPR